MCACDNRQLSQAQREAGYDQQRTGVVQALRPFSGSATIENLLDYINRELVPALRNARSAVNDVYLQVADNAPSANPLAYYFSESTANADPTAGRVRLNASPQNTATVIRLSQENGRLQDVTPWLDVMSGGPTTPLGTVTLIDAINPGRFLRFDLNTMTDAGAYWNLGVTFIEGSHADPFVEDEAVTLGFISGVSAAGSTVPVGSLSPIATDTFLGNISGSTAAPSAVPLADVDSTSIVYDAASHTFRRPALTGFAEASANSNATTSAEPIVTYSASTNMSAERVLTSSTSNTISTAVANQIAVQRAAISGAIAIAADANASLFAGIRDNGSAETDRTNLNFVSGDSNTAVVTDDAGNDELEVTFNYVGSTTNVNLENLTGDQNVVDISTLRCGGSVTVESVSAAYSIDGFTAKTDGFWFWYIDRRTSGTAIGQFLEDIGATTTSIRNENEEATHIGVAGRALLYYVNNRWRVAAGSPPGRLLRATTYTSGSGTHTYLTHARSAEVELVGQGGGGGGAGVAEEFAGGGCAGSYHRLHITTLPTSSAYNVGDSSGGGGSGATSTAGGAGEDTTFVVDGDTYRAEGGTGGEGGASGAPGALSAKPTSFTYTVFTARGAPGGWGAYFNDHGVSTLGGRGGDGPWGGGGVSTENNVGLPGDAPGAGGSGGSSFSGTDRNGGDGADGIIIVKEYS